MEAAVVVYVVVASDMATLTPTQEAALHPNLHYPPPLYLRCPR